MVNKIKILGSVSYFLVFLSGCSCELTTDVVQKDKDGNVIHESHEKYHGLEAAGKVMEIVGAIGVNPFKSSDREFVPTLFGGETVGDNYHLDHERYSLEYPKHWIAGKVTYIGSNPFNEYALASGSRSSEDCIALYDERKPSVYVKVHIIRPDELAQQDLGTAVNKALDAESRSIKKDLRDIYHFDNLNENQRAAAIDGKEGTELIVRGQGSKDWLEVHGIVFIYNGEIYLIDYTDSNGMDGNDRDAIRGVVNSFRAKG